MKTIGTILLGVFLLGLGTWAARSLSRERVESDLAQRVTRTLSDGDGTSRFSRVRVDDVDHLDVALGGKVSIQKDRAEAVEITQHVPGVGRVIDSIAVEAAIRSQPTHDKPSSSESQEPPARLADVPQAPRPIDEPLVTIEDAPIEDEPTEDDTSLRLADTSSAGVLASSPDNLSETTDADSLDSIPTETDVLATEPGPEDTAPIGDIAENETVDELTPDDSERATSAEPQPLEENTVVADSVDETSGTPQASLANTADASDYVAGDEVATDPLVDPAAGTEETDVVDNADDQFADAAESPPGDADELADDPFADNADLSNDDTDPVDQSVAAEDDTDDLFADSDDAVDDNQPVADDADELADDPFADNADLSNDDTDPVVDQNVAAEDDTDDPFADSDDAVDGNQSVASDADELADDPFADVTDVETTEEDPFADEQAAAEGEDVDEPQSDPDAVPPAPTIRPDAIEPAAEPTDSVEEETSDPLDENIFESSTPPTDDPDVPEEDVVPRVDEPDPDQRSARFQLNLQPGQIVARGELPSAALKYHVLREIQQNRGPCSLVDLLTVEPALEESTLSRNLAKLSSSLAKNVPSGNFQVDDQGSQISGQVYDASAMQDLVAAVQTAFAGRSEPEGLDDLSIDSTATRPPTTSEPTISPSPNIGPTVSPNPFVPPYPATAPLPVELQHEAALHTGSLPIEEPIPMGETPAESQPASSTANWHANGSVTQLLETQPLEYVVPNGGPVPAPGFGISPYHSYSTPVANLSGENTWTPLPTSLPTQPSYCCSSGCCQPLSACSSGACCGKTVPHQQCNCNEKTNYYPKRTD